MSKTVKQLRPIIILIIGILLITLSFVFWFYTVPPFATLTTYTLNRPSTTKNLNTTASLIEYFGHNEQKAPTPFNESRPMDYLINTTLRVTVTYGGPVEITVYIGDKIVFNVQTNTTMTEIRCNTTRYLSYIQNGIPPPAGIFPNITSTISASWLDAFSGGPVPYMLVKNLNATSSASVSYSFSYTGIRRSSSGIPLFMFIIGVIIIIIEGLVLLRAAIKRLRER
ncbi:MAG: hypothetical protein ACUVT5_03745 [Candidatus Bathyarchaeales archaeon]